MNSKVITKISHFTKNRLIELGGFGLILVGFFILISILSYSPDDPNFIYGSNTDEIKNIGGLTSKPQLIIFPRMTLIINLKHNIINFAGKI